MKSTRRTESGDGVRIAHPCFRWLKFAALLPIATAAVGAELPFSIAGITSRDQGPGWVIVELAPGEQRLVREGGSLGPLTVLEVTARAVRLRYAGREFVVALQGGTPDPVATPVQALDEVVRLPLDMERLREASFAIAQQPDVTPENVNALFGFPGKTRVIAVDAVPVSTARETVDALIEAFVGGGTPHKLILGDAEGSPNGRVYLLPTP